MNSVTIRLAITLFISVIFAIWMAVQIGQGNIYVPITVITFITVPLVVAAINKSATFSIKLVMFLILGFAAMGKGFAHVAIAPPFYVSEMVLAVSFLLVFGGLLAGKTRVVSYNRFLNNSIIAFIGLCFLSLGLNFGKFGMFALRDTSLGWYALFYFITYGALKNAASLNYARKMMLLAIGIGMFSKLLLAVGGDNIRIALHAISLRGRPIIEWSYDTMVPLCVAAVCLLFIVAVRKMSLKYAVLCCIAGMAFALGSKSAFYFAMIAGMLWMTVSGKKSFVIFGASGMIIAVLLVLSLASITSNERLQNISDQLTDEARGVSSDSFIVDAQDASERSTTGWRLAWAAWIFHEVVDKNIALGLGMGADIETDFAIQYWGMAMDDIVYAGNSAGGTRYPHNVVFTVIARLGFIGLIPFTMILLVVIKESLWYARILKRNAYLNIADVGIWIVIVAGLANGFIQATFETPYAGIIFWSCLAMAMRIKEQHIAIWQANRARLANEENNDVVYVKSN